VAAALPLKLALSLLTGQIQDQHKEKTMSDTKACSYCGEQILTVAIKCKHCGSELTVSSNAVRNQLKMRPTFVALLVLVLGIIGAGVAYNWSQTGALSGRGFTDADITNIEQSIRTEFAKRSGVNVEEVKMIKESPTKLVGFAKIRIPLLGTAQKSCSATMGSDGQSMWQCN
jgi:hypothetical protein